MTQKGRIWSQDSVRRRSEEVISHCQASISLPVKWVIVEIQWSNTHRASCKWLARVSSSESIPRYCYSNKGRDNALRSHAGRFQPEKTPDLIECSFYRFWPEREMESHSSTGVSSGLWAQATSPPSVLQRSPGNLTFSVSNSSLQHVRAETERDNM